jgi:hypothetical protein
MSLVVPMKKGPAMHLKTRKKDSGTVLAHINQVAGEGTRKMS